MTDDSNAARGVREPGERDRPVAHGGPAGSGKWKIRGQKIRKIGKMENTGTENRKYGDTIHIPRCSEISGAYARFRALSHVAEGLSVWIGAGCNFPA
jgi:hypothetical protein